MRQRDLLSYALLLALPLFGAGCVVDEQPNNAPIIDSVNIESASTPAMLEALNGEYSVPITILFHDNDREAVTHVRYRMPSANLDKTIDIATPNPTREAATVIITIPASAPKDTHDLTITIVDGRGKESLPLSQTITLL
ncbi:MAG: hypothetical protein KF819_38725 [Labilithrix sp.]|nr:hypothetical protein [Labilithrix sp.]